jgi:hypothetical protein
VEIVKDQRARRKGGLLCTCKKGINVKLVVPIILEESFFRLDELELLIYILIREHE